MPPDQDTQEQSAGTAEGQPLADFSALEAQAKALEGAGQEAQQEREQEQAAEAIASAADELLGALEMLRMMAAPLMEWWPKFESTWSDKTLKAIAKGGAEVMQRHGWTLEGAWTHLGPYVALLAAVLPPSLATWQAVQQRRIELAEASRPHHRTQEAPAP